MRLLMCESNIDEDAGATHTFLLYMIFAGS